MFSCLLELLSFVRNKPICGSIDFFFLVLVLVCVWLNLRLSRNLAIDVNKIDNCLLLNISWISVSFSFTTAIQPLYQKAIMWTQYCQELHRQQPSSSGESDPWMPLKYQVGENKAYGRRQAFLFSLVWALAGVGVWVVSTSLWHPKGVGSSIRTIAQQCP